MEPSETRNVLTQLRRGTLEYCVLALLHDDARYAFDLVNGQQAWSENLGNCGQDARRLPMRFWIPVPISRSGWKRLIRSRP